MTELKKCPFCGSEPGYIKDVDGEWIWCSNVECMGGNGSGERWNARPLEDALQAKLALAVEAMKMAYEDLEAYEWTDLPDGYSVLATVEKLREVLAKLEEK